MKDGIWAEWKDYMIHGKPDKSGYYEVVTFDDISGSLSVEVLYYPSEWKRTFCGGAKRAIRYRGMDA